ncbi:sensor histidine kinase [Mucilaginibacter terrae]|uniref:Two-component system LytT family sensor kinase n=1 Tax=Mucilaginibacter terrae TaxID=1955052 RepID=A0ABU3GY10_9SPHI|nr:histidine kinase [Mucilaginibacter terrae]MDT3404316.1 two-component system LytT family sensor kinase [Mucilaginibacter terrae]
MIDRLTNWIKSHRLHLLIWGIFIFWETIVIGLISGVFGHPMTYAAHYTSIIILFYVHALYALPWVFKNDTYYYWRLPLTVAFEVSVFIVLSYLIDLALSSASILKDGQAFELNLRYSMRTLYRGLYFLGFSTGFFYLKTYLEEKKKSDLLERQRLNEIIQRQKAEEEVIRAQNAFLIAQINPHFFFNTLDYLYHNVLEIAPNVADAISSLAGMMRFAISADKIGGVIKLGDEVEQVQNLVYLHQVRQQMYIRLEIAEGVEDFFVIPLILLTLTENIFKHGNLLVPEEEAFLRIYFDEDNFYIETFNLINQVITSIKSNTGLSNIGKRLTAAYPDNVSFAYGSDGNSHFQVSIKIALSALDQGVTFSYPSLDIDKE